jgi:hypothetical protein
VSSISRWAIVAGALALSACSGSGSTSNSEAPPPPSIIDVPRVDLIDDAVAALEAQLGAHQQYFEINATPQLVNLFVALNDGTLVQPWVYVDGELSSTDGRQATGFTFEKTALDFDPDKVLSRIQSELPQSRADIFFIEGGEAGNVRYTVAVTSQQGGQLVVVVGPDGEVQSVIPN